MNENAKAELKFKNLQLKFNRSIEGRLKVLEEKLENLESQDD